MFRQRQSHELLPILGVRAGNHVPDEGTKAVEVDGVLTWIKPKGPEGNPTRKHRVLCECPRCFRWLSAGRLFQHIGTKACSDKVAHLERIKQGMK